MRKITLPVIFFLLLLFPLGVYAQDYKSCLNAQTVERSACTKVRNNCVGGCTAPEGPADENCIRGCDKNLNVCYSRASANYDLCVKGGKQITPSPESKELSPDEKLLTCEQLSKLSSSEDCLPSIMVDYKVWCARPGENLTEFAPDQIKIVPPNRAPDYAVDPSLTDEELKGFQKQSQSDQVKQNRSSGDGNPFSIFGINPYQMWLNLQEWAEAGAFYGTGGLYDSTLSILSHGVGVTPSWERDAEAIKASEELKAELKFIEDAQARYFSLTQQEKNKLAEIINRWEGRVDAGGNPAIINNGSTTIQLQPFNGQPGVLKPAPYWPMLNSGAADVIVEPQNGQQFELQTPNAEIFVIGTQFSVIYNPEKNQTLVAVYKGEVEVKTKDGKTATVLPDEGKPGIVVITQKLSPVKLGIIGAVLVVFLGGVTLLFKKMFVSKGITKRRK